MGNKVQKQSSNLEENTHVVKFMNTQKPSEIHLKNNIQNNKQYNVSLNNPQKEEQIIFSVDIDPNKKRGEDLIKNMERTLNSKRKSFKVNKEFEKSPMKSQKGNYLRPPSAFDNSPQKNNNNNQLLTPKNRSSIHSHSKFTHSANYLGAINEEDHSNSNSIVHSQQQQIYMSHNNLPASKKKNISEQFQNNFMNQVQKDFQHKTGSEFNQDQGINVRNDNQINQQIEDNIANTRQKKQDPTKNDQKNKSKKGKQLENSSRNANNPEESMNQDELKTDRNKNNISSSTQAPKYEAGYIYKEFDIEPLRRKNYFQSENKEIIINQHNSQRPQDLSQQETLTKLVEHGNSITDYILGNQNNIIRTIQAETQGEVKEQVNNRKDGVQRSKFCIKGMPGYEKIFQYQQQVLPMKKQNQTINSSNNIKSSQKLIK